MKAIELGKVRPFLMASITLMVIRGVKAVDSVLLSFKRLCDSYSAALLELHSAWAVMFVGIWLANPFTEVVPSNPVLWQLGASHKTEFLIGLLLIAVAWLRMVAVRRAWLHTRTVLALCFGGLWFASTVLHLTTTPLRLGMAICPAYFVADAISYIRLSGQIRLERMP